MNQSRDTAPARRRCATKRGAGASLVAALLVCLSAGGAHAADPFEVQVYDGTANPPGVFGLELHVNQVADGLRSAAPPELSADGVTHFTIEASLGIAPWWEVGAYLQAARRADGQLDYAGVKLRSKFVTTRAFSATVRLGLNIELSRLPATYEADRWGSELRPIAAWENARWLLAVNPIIDTPLAGSGWSAGPRFEPAAMALRKIGPWFDLGVEYYAALGPLASFAAPAMQEHYLYEVVNLLCVPRLEVNAGVGEGLTAASNRLVVKVIVGWMFGAADGG